MLRAMLVFFTARSARVMPPLLRVRRKTAIRLQSATVIPARENAIHMLTISPRRWRFMDGRYKMFRLNPRYHRSVSRRTDRRTDGRTGGRAEKRAAGEYGRSDGKRGFRSTREYIIRRPAPYESRSLARLYSRRSGISMILSCRPPPKRLLYLCSYSFFVGFTPSVRPFETPRSQEEADDAFSRGVCMYLRIRACCRVSLIMSMLLLQSRIWSICFLTNFTATLARNRL